MAAKHGGLFTYEQALTAARRLLGPLGDVWFIAKAPRAERFNIIQYFRYEGVKHRGVVGQGPTWNEALADAITRKAAYDAERGETP